MKRTPLFMYVRAVGAILCILTLNAVVLVAFLNPDIGAIDPGDDVPRWSIYVLMFLIGAFLGLDAILDATPLGERSDVSQHPDGRDDEDSR